MQEKLLQRKQIRFHSEQNAGHQAIAQTRASTKAGKEQGLIKAAERGWSLEVLS